MTRRNQGEFSQKVKNALYDRAGGVCSELTCKVTTISPKNQDSASGDGEAAHITAAAKGGPRWCETMSEEERKSAKNGIWMCASCATKIDKFVDYYSIEKLHEMKFVREFCQKLIFQNQELRFMATFLPIKLIDNIVHTFFPKIEERIESIIDKITQEAQNWMKMYYESTSNLREIRPQIPASAVSPLSTEIENHIKNCRMIEIQRNYSVSLTPGKYELRNFVAAVEKIVRNRFPDIENSEKDVIFFMNTSITLTSKNLSTGVYSANHVFIPTATISLKVAARATSTGNCYIKICHTTTNTSCLNWLLESDQSSKGTTFKNYITARFSHPKSTWALELQRNEINKQIELLQELALGGTPIGRLSSHNIDLSTDKDDDVKIEFEIENKIKKAELGKLIDDYKKMEFACDLSERTSLEIIFNKTYFDSELSLSLITESVLQLRTQIDACIKISPLEKKVLLATSRNTVITACYKLGRIIFNENRNSQLII